MIFPFYSRTLCPLFNLGTMVYANDKFHLKIPFKAIFSVEKSDQQLIALQSTKAHNDVPIHKPQTTL